MNLTLEIAKSLSGTVISFGKIKLSGCLFPCFSKFMKKNKKELHFTLTTFDALSMDATREQVFTIIDAGTFGMADDGGKTKHFAMELLSSLGITICFFSEGDTPFFLTIVEKMSRAS